MNDTGEEFSAHTRIAAKAIQGIESRGWGWAVAPARWDDLQRYGPSHAHVAAVVTADGVYSKYALTGSVALSKAYEAALAGEGATT